MNAPENNERKPGQTCDPILLWSKDLQGKKSQPVEDFAAQDIAGLYKRLSASMAYYRGVGIAAPQISVFLRAAIVDMEGVRMYMVNPEIVSRKGSSVKRHGCLSIPGATTHGRRIQNQANTTLSEEITVQYLDGSKEKQEKTLTGWLSHAVQHELLHLDGEYFIDRCGGLGRRLVLEKYDNFLRFTQPG